MSLDGVQRASKEKDRIKRGMEEKRRGGVPGERPVKEPSFITSICGRHSEEGTQSRAGLRGINTSGSFLGFPGVRNVIA